MNEQTDNESTPPADIKLDGDVIKTHYELDRGGLAFFLILFLVIGTLVYTLNSKETKLSRVANTELAQAEVLTNYFEGIELDSNAAFVWDVKKKKALFAKNEEMQLPLASITKLMTVAVVSEYISLNETLVVSEQSLFAEGDSGLLAHEKWNVKDLIDFTLMVSSNDGASALANAAGAIEIIRSGDRSESPQKTFIEEMNRLAKEIGLTQTYFLNETGLDSTEATSGGYGSARDAALLMNYVVTLNPELIDSTVYKSREISSLSNFIHTATNTNQSIGDVPGLIASKTGFTDLAGGNLVIAFDAGINRPIIVSVLRISIHHGI